MVRRPVPKGETGGLKEGEGGGAQGSAANACNTGSATAGRAVGEQKAAVTNPLQSRHPLGRGVPRHALERKGPQRRPQRRLGRRLEGVAEAVGGGYCRLQMPLKLALGVRETVAEHRLGAQKGGGRGVQCTPGCAPPYPTPRKRRHGRARQSC